MSDKMRGMKILFVDKDKEFENLFHEISSIGHYDVSFCHDCINGINDYDEHKYDIVLINFSLDFGQKILDHILSKNPKQKIITISNDLVCSETSGGEFCQTNYNKRRLLKPVNVFELVRLINNFDDIMCEFKDKFDYPCGLIQIMEKVVQQYSKLEYDKESKTVTFEKIDKQVIEFINVLESKSIKHSVFENTIKLEC